jgi:2-polyprenyl-6-methoxyphenol hydroxylase-like FAD-dependent oxidoreductase
VLPYTHARRPVNKIEKSKNTWLVETDSSTIRARTIIGADGALSIVRKYICGPIPKEHLIHLIAYHVWS